MPSLKEIRRLEAERLAKAAKRKVGRADRRARKNATLATEAPLVSAKAIGAKPAAPVMGHIKQARQNLVEAFEGIGGVPQLIKWGKANLTEFYRIWSRLVPKEAAEEQNSSLETLLAMLAARGDQPVATAAYEIGVDKMRQGQAGADAEDAALALAAFEGGTIQ